MKHIFFATSFLTILFCSCVTQNTADQLIEIDREFSEFSEKKGFNNAFIEYAHPEAVMLKENSMPIIGKQAITEIYEKADTSGVHFSWEPLYADIAMSGELGYTYGLYKLKVDTIVEQGTYVSIWKLDQNGEWKYVLDSGNEGLGE